MQYSSLGKTGLRVSNVGFGTSPFGGAFGKVSDLDAAKNAVGHAIDAGINFFDTSPFYGDGVAETLLGRFLEGHRKNIVLSSKVGAYSDGIDFRPERIRSSVHESLARLGTDYLDIVMFHDIENVNLDALFAESFGALLALKEEGICRFIGVTGYPIFTIQRAIQELEIDVALNYGHSTLLNDELITDLVPLANQHGVGLINASAVALGLLTERGSRLEGNPSAPEVFEAADRVRDLCRAKRIDVATIANQFSIQRSGCATTLIGTTNPANVDIAVRAVEEPIDEQLLAEVLEITASVRRMSWRVGLPANNGPTAAPISV